MTTSAEIDIDPPKRDSDEKRWLLENLTRIKSLIAVLDAGQGVSGTFTTADAKTVTVTDGIVTSIV